MANFAHTPAFLAGSPLLSRSATLVSFQSVCQRPRSRARAPARLRRLSPGYVQMAAGGGSFEGDEAPAGRVISTALEVSFRTVWVNLLTSGVGQAYEESIQQFCVACVAARKAGYTVTTLKFELSANEMTSEDPEIQKAQLNEREKETRLIWISIVFLTLRRYGFVAGNTPVNDDILDHFKISNEGLARGLEALVENVADAADRGFTLSTYKMERAMKRAADEEPPSPSTASIESQWGRIVFSTIGLLPDSLREAKKKQ